MMANFLGIIKGVLREHALAPRYRNSCGAQGDSRALSLSLSLSFPSLSLSILLYLDISLCTHTHTVLFAQTSVNVHFTYFGLIPEQLYLYTDIMDTNEKFRYTHTHTLTLTHITCDLCHVITSMYTTVPVKGSSFFTFPVLTSWKLALNRSCVFHQCTQYLLQSSKVLQKCSIED